MRRRTLKTTASGMEILQLLRRLKRELGMSYRLMSRDLHIV